VSRYKQQARKMVRELEQESMIRKESLETFYTGLRDIVDALWTRLECARDELP